VIENIQLDLKGIVPREIGALPWFTYGCKI
jgi:hypothetical protein